MEVFLDITAEDIQVIGDLKRRDDHERKVHEPEKLVRAV